MYKIISWVIKMYSQNDYRNYLEHKWTWPNGNNSKEYNHHYYETHKEKWAKYLKNVGDTVSNIADDVDYATRDITGHWYKKEADREEEEAKKRGHNSEGFYQKSLHDQNLEVAAADELYEKASENRKKAENSFLNKALHPIDTVSDWAYDNLGLREKENKRISENKYNQYKEWYAKSDSEFGKEVLGLYQKQYEKNLKSYYSTPLGKVDKYIDAGKAAVSLFSDYVKNN